MAATDSDFMGEDDDSEIEGDDEGKGDETKPRNIPITEAASTWVHLLTRIACGAARSQPQPGSASVGRSQPPGSDSPEMASGAFHQASGACTKHSPGLVVRGGVISWLRREHS